RERREEILPLARFFIGKHSRPGEAPVEINSNLSQTLMAHLWPGNIRELENVIRTLVVLGDPDRAADDLRQAAVRRQRHPYRNGASQAPDYRQAYGSEGDRGSSLSNSIDEGAFPGIAKSAAA